MAIFQSDILRAELRAVVAQWQKSLNFCKPFSDLFLEHLFHVFYIICPLGRHENWKNLDSWMFFLTLHLEWGFLYSFFLVIAVGHTSA